MLEDSAKGARRSAEASAIDESTQAHWVRAAAGGDQTAFRKIVDANHEVVYRVALRSVGSKADADDIVQETFVRAWKRLASIRDPNSLTGWLCRIARNASTDLHRKRGRRKTRSLDQETTEGVGPLVEALADDGPSPSELLESASLQAALAELIGEIKEKHRVVLLLREVDGMSYEQIADALGVPQGTVESRLHRARKELAKKIERMRASHAREANQ